jgi:RNA polymerase sigma-70 factor (ECF subfamily)
MGKWRVASGTDARGVDRTGDGVGPVDRGVDRMDDAALVAAARDGDERAFAELYRRHEGAVRRALSDNVHDPERRRELVQECFYRAYSRLHLLREPSRFRPWLLQIGRNAAIDDLRSRSRARLEPIDDELIADPAHDGPESTAELQVLAAAVRAGMAHLSARDAAAISMVAHLGFGPAEVAAALDISYGNAKVVLHRARQRLRDALVRQELLDPATAGEA